MSTNDDRNRHIAEQGEAHDRRMNRMVRGHDPIVPGMNLKLPVAKLPPEAVRVIDDLITNLQRTQRELGRWADECWGMQTDTDLQKVVKEGSASIERAKIAKGVSS